MSGRSLLIAAAVGDAIAAALHLAVIAGGPDWYRFFGAGEGMARMAERGLLEPHLYTIGITAILAVWSAYALAGAGVIRRLPLTRVALVAISAVCLIRGLGVFVSLPTRVGAPPGFWMWSSLIVLVLGLLHAAGTWRAWSRL